MNTQITKEKNKDTEVYEITCGNCGKVIKSLSESQADYNMRVHRLTCPGGK